MSERKKTTGKDTAGQHKTPKRRKLSHEILGILGIAFAIAIFLFEFLYLTATSLSENYCDYNDLTLTFAQQAELDMWIYGASMMSAIVFFTALFLFLLGQKITYIKKLTEGVNALRTHRMDFELPLEGNNELTQLAETINYLSATEKEMREKERALQEEKEQLIRSLSHDIRTPLTSILSYSELLLTQQDADAEKRKAQDDDTIPGSSKAREKEYLSLILQKAGQIKELTDVLLDGGKRNPEFFRDGRLLMEQLAAEMEETLEDAWETDETDPPRSFCIDLTACAPFSGTFDLQELRRIFDNLTSNILKYADLARPVRLTIRTRETGIVIEQDNFKRIDAATAESHQIGLSSIRRIAHNYGGFVGVEQDDARFTITITLSEI